MMEELSSSETSVFTRATRRHFPKDAILHSHRRENLKSYWLLVIINFWLKTECNYYQLNHTQSFKKVHHVNGDASALSSNSSGGALGTELQTGVR
jgi:hypothetical protein